MTKRETGVCPDCCYPLTGLSTPRCPECGVTFNERLLTEPALAIPRPAWERRPHVSLVYAIWRTLMDITFHPRRFFDSIQQPDRLRHSITFHLVPIILLTLIAFTYAVISCWLAGFSPTIRDVSSYVAYLFELLKVCTLNIMLGLCVVEIPLFAVFLIADIIYWNDRRTYRVFFKGVLYTNCIFIWYATAFLGIVLSLKIFSSDIDRLLLYLHNEYAIKKLDWIWTNWLIACAITWQYMLVALHILCQRIAVIESSRPYRSMLLLLIVMWAWLVAMYLVLVDVHFGLRIVIGLWSRGHVQW